MAFGIGGGNAMRPISGLNTNTGERGEPMGGPVRGFDSFKKGGKVKKTGLIKAEKGERVLTKKQQHERGEKKMGKR